MVGPTSYFDPARVDELDPRTADLVRRRAIAMGPAYRLFYREPLEFVRGERAHLFDADGADYLDAYNNVPIVGHANPRVATAIAEQAARLNTHTRYLSEATIRYAERLLDTLPAPLAQGHVMFTCTGSESNDLALRIARAATGATGVLVTENAYHGVTAEIAAISPSLVGADVLATWVRTVPAPGPGIDFAAGVRAGIDSLAAAGLGVAALVVDTVFSSDGVHTEVDGFSEAVDAAREAGGLFIADEVQAGFRRLGGDDLLWGFEHHGLEPDLVTLGKPMGNGHPVAGLVARAELIEAFARQSRYFNTFGGNSVSIAAATAVLDELQDHRPSAHDVASVGARLREGIAALGDPRLAAIRGAGLYLGVDVVDGEGAPDEAFTLDIVNGLRERRVLLAASGPANATLKIRPPLVFDDRDADRLLTELAAVLAER